MAGPRAVRRHDLERAVAAGVLGAAEAEALWQFLGAGPEDLRPRFDLVHVLWYAGALIIIGAMGLFTTLAFAQLGGGVLALIAVVYAVLLTAAGQRLWQRGLRIPGGLLIAVAVTMAPLFTYGVQDALGWSGPTPRLAATATSISGSRRAGCRWRSRRSRPAWSRSIAGASRS